MTHNIKGNISTNIEIADQRPFLAEINFDRTRGYLFKIMQAKDTSISDSLA